MRSSKLFSVTIAILSVFFLSASKNLQSAEDANCLPQTTDYYLGLAKSGGFSDYSILLIKFRADVSQLLASAGYNGFSKCILESMGKLPERDRMISSYLITDSELKVVAPDSALAVGSATRLLYYCERRHEDCKDWLHDLYLGLAIDSAKTGSHKQAKNYKNRAYQVRGSLPENKRGFGARRAEDFAFIEAL